MFQNTHPINPLNWELLVKETLKRRKERKLTQAKHAALAHVSIPTMIAFEKGSKSLSLENAFSILNIVGLVEHPQKSEEKHYHFRQEAYQRWKTLASSFDVNAPERFSNGLCLFDYFLEGHLKTIDKSKHIHLLEEISKVEYSGWSPFLVRNNPESIFYPTPIQTGLQHWIRNTYEYKTPYYDYWEAHEDARFLIIRGFLEDYQETFPPRTIFDNTLPIRFITECILHALRASIILRKKENTPLTIYLNFYYHGLLGRVLKSWSDPLKTGYLQNSGAAKIDDVFLKTIIMTDNISDTIQLSSNAQALNRYIFPLIKTLFESFGITHLEEKNVESDIKNVLKRKIIHPVMS